MMDDDISAPTEAAGAPKWMVTFADLSTLLLCFFVLLLSFSEMDVAKFKQLAGSMREAFGVQADIKSKHIPKGTSVVAREFSPGEPQPTVLNQVRQFTIDSNKNTLRFADGDELESLKEYQEALDEVRRDAEMATEILLLEIEEGMIEVRTDGARTVIQIQERGSFGLGSADVEAEFKPVLEKIFKVLQSTEGVINVSGHTDDLPIATARFRSNWELSAARAVSVVHELLAFKGIDPGRFVVAGYGDTRPLVPNEGADQRALNRRVDISIIRGSDRVEIAESGP